MSAIGQSSRNAARLLAIVLLSVLPLQFYAAGLIAFGAWGPSPHALMG